MFYDLLEGINFILSAAGAAFLAWAAMILF